MKFKRSFLYSVQSKGCVLKINTLSTDKP